LRPHFPLWTSSATPPFSFETFPHAATCALLGRVARGRDKAVDRLAVLRGAGIRLPEQRLSQDDVDAALCALAAKLVASGDMQAFGQQQEGFIVIPRLRGEAATLSPGP
jgi:predicted RNase H-like nuclease